MKNILTRPLPAGFGPGYVFGMLTVIASGLLAGLIYSTALASEQLPRDPQPHYLPACAQEDGGPELPCVWKDTTPDGKFILYTK